VAAQHKRHPISEDEGEDEALEKEEYEEHLVEVAE